MSSQTNTNLSWRSALVGAMAAGALATGLMIGVGAPMAFAAPPTPAPAPADPTTDSDAPPPKTADQVLAIIQQDYDLGAGGGELSNLIHQVMKLRSLGYMPSAGNKAAIVAALDRKPNQTPMIEALKETAAYQLVQQARAQSAPAPSTTLGIGQGQGGTQYDPNGNRNVDQGGISVTIPGGGG